MLARDKKDIAEGPKSKTRQQKRISSFILQLIVGNLLQQLANLDVYVTLSYNITFFVGD